MKTVKFLEVRYHGKKVGELALLKNSKIAFQYDFEWLLNGFSISPISLPLEKKVFISTKDTFDGLFGVFDDSLPDGWGRLLVDRVLMKNGINPATLNPLQRLAIVGNSGMGALEYVPSVSLYEDLIDIADYDVLSAECSKILMSQETEQLDDLFLLGASSGGARPKVLIKYHEEDWIVKFKSSMDNINIGEEEYRYSLCAKKCGIEMPDTKLFESKNCLGYFGCKRFDREKDKKIHMISVGALLETSHRIPNLDYNIIMKLTLFLTKSYDEIEKMFRLMCFNIYAHNRDDHSKNFSFLYDETEKRYKVSPAYDLTFSNSLMGEHATCIDGNGNNPSLKDIMRVADKIGMSKEKALQIANEIKEIVENDLHDILQRYS